MSDTPPIAIDAMGGDFGPSETVPAAVMAARESGVNVLLVGDEEHVSEVLATEDATGLSIGIVPSKGVIVEGEHPARALRTQPKASILVSVGLVKQGIAAAFVVAESAS